VSRPNAPSAERERSAEQSSGKGKKGKAIAERIRPCPIMLHGEKW
jgi:hypothetical protein